MKKENHHYVYTISIIGKELKGNPKNEMLSIQQYQQEVIQFLLSQKIMDRFGGRVIKRILRDEESLSYLMHVFMKADYKHDYSKGASKQTLRYSVGVWFIIRYITRWRRIAPNVMKSLDYELDHHKNKCQDHMVHVHYFKDLQDGVEDYTLDSILKSEQNEQLIKLIHHPCLTDREQDVIYRYYINRETLEEIGNKHDLTKERIRQIRVRSVAKLKEYMEEHPEQAEYWVEN